MGKYNKTPGNIPDDDNVNEAPLPLEQDPGRMLYFVDLLYFCREDIPS